MVFEKVVVLGAGCIGCWVGGGIVGISGISARQVTFVVRSGSDSGRVLLRAVSTHGISLKDKFGKGASRSRQLSSSNCLFLPEDEAGPAIAAADLILVATKRPAIPNVAQMLSAHARRGVPIVTLMNGVDTAQEMQECMHGEWPVIEGMVNMSVISSQNGGFIKFSPTSIIKLDGTKQPYADQVARLLRAAGLQCDCVPNIRDVTHGKLLINLFNAVNALSGGSIFELLLARDYREVVSLSISEALQVYKAAGVSVSPWSYRYLPWLFAAMRRMDLLVRLARWLMESVCRVELDHSWHSSMWEDLRARRPRTEIEHINGCIVHLGRKHGVPTPINSRIVALVKAAEQSQAGLPSWQGNQLLKLVTSMH